jgi:L-aspartate oxidase
VHGANRLASNSLLEAAVFGARAGRAAGAEAWPAAAASRNIVAPELPAPDLQRLRQLMSRHAGVVRDATGLTTLLLEIEAMQAQHGRSPALVAARLIAACALARKENRGGHFRADATPQAAPRRTFVKLAQVETPVGALRFAAE